MKEGRLSRLCLFAIMFFLVMKDSEFSARAFEPQFQSATLQIGNVTLKPTEVVSPLRNGYLVGSNLFYVSADNIQSPPSGPGPAWTTHSQDGAFLNWLTASTNTAYLLGYRLGKDHEFMGYDSPARVRCLDLQTGNWSPDLPIHDTTPAGFQTTNVLAALAYDHGVFVLTALTKKGVTNAEDNPIAAYNLSFFPTGAQNPAWTKQFPSAGERPYTGGYIWGVPPPVYAGSDIQQLSWIGDRLLVCPEAMQPVYCIDPYVGREVWRIDRIWEFQRGFIGPSVWQHYIGRFGIEEYELERTNINLARAAFDKQYQCALVGGPVCVPLNFMRDNGPQRETHSIFVAVTRSPAREWAGYLSDCLLYEFGDGGEPVSMGTLPQVVNGSQFCVRGGDVIWKCQNETFVRVSAARSAPMMSMGPGGSDCVFNLAWARRIEYEDPKAWFVAGNGSDSTAFGENYAYCLPDGGYVLRRTNTLYSFPIAAVDLSTGIETILTLNVPFKGSFPLPTSNTSTDTMADGSKSVRALSSHLLSIIRLTARGRTLEITLASETQTAVLDFGAETALPGVASVSPRTADSSPETARAKALSVPPKERDEALRTAALDGDLELVKALLNAGADPKCTDRDGDSVLMLAVASANADVVEFLLRAGLNVSDPNHDGQTPLIVAGATGRAKIVSLLLKAGADKNAADARGMTALMLAAENADTAGAVDALLQAGADPNLKDNQGRTALQIAERAHKFNRSGAEEVINLLKPVTKSSR